MIFAIFCYVAGRLTESPNTEGLHNDVIMTGPDLLNPLVHVLARFRKGKNALMADITKDFFKLNCVWHKGIYVAYCGLKTMMSIRVS